MNVYEYIALNNSDNNDGLMEYAEYSQSLLVQYPNYPELTPKTDPKNTISNFAYTDEPMFGYEDINWEEKVDGIKNKIIKGAIILAPDRRFLRKVGILIEDDLGGNSELPIIGFFKEQDNVTKDCLISMGTFSTEEKQIIEITKTLIVIDIGAVGNFVTGKIYYKLAPYRGT